MRSRSAGRVVSSIPESNVPLDAPRARIRATRVAATLKPVPFIDVLRRFDMPSRRDWLRSSALGAAGILVSRRIVAAEPPPVVAVYKDPGCECCARWVKHLSANGFVATVRDTPDMASVKRTMGVPDALQSCHTAVVGKYLIEGHVPADVIKKLLAEKP